jgi:hypothetical protein
MSCLNGLANGSLVESRHLQTHILSLPHIGSDVVGPHDPSSRSVILDRAVGASVESPR